MNKKKIAAIVLVSLTALLVIVQTNAQEPQQPQPPAKLQPPKGNPDAAFEHPKNLKVLPKNISPKALQETMRMYSRSLGVRCGFCHAMKEAKPGERPELDQASDAKPEKLSARKMITMTADINKKYIQKINKEFEEITCVSCHHGSAKPMVSIDSLPPQPKK